MQINVNRHPEYIAHLPFVEINQENPGLPYHPADLVQKTKNWILKNKDFATCHEIPILVIQEMIRRKVIPCTQVELFYDSRRIHLDVKGEMVEPWPENQCESLFELDFYLRYGQ